MITNNDIRKLTDYILLNAYSVNSSGLYNGKVGMSLCLFEVSRLLNDDFIEEHAFELLQESLVSKTEDIRFENGLSGIGFVLNYLIDNRFIDADFNEFFGMNLEKIRTVLESPSQPDNAVMQLTTLYLLKTLYYREEIRWTKKSIKTLTEIACKQLIERFDDFCLPQKATNKINVLKLYKSFLKVTVSFPDVYDASTLFQKYTNLYMSGKIASDYAIGHYMKNSATGQLDPNCNDAANRNMELASQNIYPEALSLSQQIDLLYLMHQNESNHISQIKQIEDHLFGLLEVNLEKSVIQKLNPRSFIAGYESGVARLLLYIVFIQNRKDGQDVTRFDKLFK